ncbi:MAG: hypothetical protein FWF82_04780 [Oscillospiraceae bacterium]|nr:hypothetical protein [Oscillospiraceae bacterium]
MVIRKNKFPITIAFLVCFLIITLTFNANNVGVPASGNADNRPSIVLDAGHGASV